MPFAHVFLFCRKMNLDTINTVLENILEDQIIGAIIILAILISAHTLNDDGVNIPMTPNKGENDEYLYEIQRVSGKNPCEL